MHEDSEDSEQKEWGQSRSRAAAGISQGQISASASNTAERPDEQHEKGHDDQHELVLRNAFEAEA